MTGQELERCRRIVSEVVMRRTKSAELAVLVVEGSGDRKVYEKFTAKPKCDVIPAGGKEALEEVMSKAHTFKVPGMAAVMDADCDHFLGRAPTSPHIFLTDVTDLDVMIFVSSAFDDFVREHAVRENDKRSARSIIDLAANVRSRVIDAALFLGLVRRLSIAHGWAIDFTSIDVSSFIDHLKVSCDIPRCTDIVIQLPRSRAFSDEQILDVLKARRSETVDPLTVVQGHDISRIFAYCSDILIGVKVDRDTVDRSLRLAYGKSMFEQTRLFVSLHTWSVNNKPFLLIN